VLGAGAGAFIVFNTMLSIMKAEHPYWKCTPATHSTFLVVYTAFLCFYFMDTTILNLRYFMDLGHKSIFLGGLV
jgi:hypothetical protein